MAAQEYYLGTQAAQELQGSQPPNPYQSQPPKSPQYQQPYGAPSYANTPPPVYSAHLQAPPPPPPPPLRHHQSHGYFKPQTYPEKPPQTQAMTAPYPQTPPAGYYPSSQPMPQPQRRPSGYLGVPLQHHRSHSQPPRVHFADEDSDRSTSLGSISDDEYSPRRHHHHHHHPHHHSSNSTSHRHGSRSRPHERTYDSDYSDRDRDRPSSRHHRHKPHKSHSYDRSYDESHKTRDTFLGAGAGTIIGDVIFPGLGTAAGLVLGGYGGRKYAQDKLRSDEGSDSGSGKKSRRRAHGGSRRAGDDGWDEKTKTYRKGAAVR